MVEDQKDHERIWLQNAEDAKDNIEGRLWCQDKVWPDGSVDDGEPTEYVRADLYATLEREVAAMRAKAIENAQQRNALSGSGSGWRVPLNAFVIAVAGDGDPYVKIQFKTLAEMQAFHAKIVGAPAAPQPTGGE